MTQVDDECKIDSQSSSTVSGTKTGIEELEERARALKYGTSELIGEYLHYCFLDIMKFLMLYSIVNLQILWCFLIICQKI